MRTVITIKALTEFRPDAAATGSVPSTNTEHVMPLPGFALGSWVGTGFSNSPVRSAYDATASMSP